MLGFAANVSAAFKNRILAFVRCVAWMERRTESGKRVKTEVTPIHPLMVEQRLSETEAVYEGLYVFDPASLGPQCGTVRLTVYSENDPDKGDTRVVDPKVLQQITRDFASL